jgi:hypothetical protein
MLGNSVSDFFLSTSYCSPVVHKVVRSYIVSHFLHKWVQRTAVAISNISCTKETSERKNVRLE